MGPQVCIYDVFIFLKMFYKETVMLCFVAFHLGLHCLLKRVYGSSV